MAFAKPNVNTVWATSGTIVSPGSAKVALGWVKEIPDFEFENWVQNRQDQFNAHVNQYGIPVWDSVTEYIAGKSYVQGSDGNIYKALTTNTNKNPVTSSSDWVRAFNAYGDSYTKTESDSKYLAKSSNLSDLNNAATARTNLSVYSKAEADSKYLAKSNNLSDLTNVATARANLSVYSKIESDLIYLAKANNLSDILSASAARTNLGVYSKGESDGRYLRRTNNLSDLDDTATARDNLDVYSRGQTYTRAEVEALLQLDPPGKIMLYAGINTPSGYIYCDGREVSRTTYADLFAAIGTTYGDGNGTTTFNVPDLRGEFVRGWDDGRGVDPGRVFGSFQEDAFQGHKHAGVSVYSTAGDGDGVDSNNEGYGNTNIVNIQNGYATDGTNGEPRVADETRPRNIALKFYIKY